SINLAWQAIAPAGGKVPWPLLGAAAATLLLVTGGYFMFGRSTRTLVMPADGAASIARPIAVDAQAQPATVHTRLKLFPLGARVFLDGVLLARPSFDLPRGTAPHHLE